MAVTAADAIAAAEEFLASTGRQPAGMLIEGEPGIGKTTLWNDIVDRAARAGRQVLSARTGRTGSALALGTVADLFNGMDPAIIAALPDVQRLAADRVLLRDSGIGLPTDERVIAAALLTSVHAMSAAAPVLIAVDDVHWLDPSSLAVLAFVARRLRGPVGVLVAERSGTSESAATWLQVGPSGALARLRVSPMSLGALHTMVSTRVGRTFSRPAIVRIAEMSGGNPFYALELARAGDPGPLRSAERLPATLADLVRLRVGDLDDDVRHVLLVAASESTPTVDLLAKASGTTVGRVTELLEVAEIDGIVAIEGNRVRFTHPLLASGIYDSAAPDRRREVHRILADIKTQPELNARHLALAADAADDATLRALDAAADAARARGAPAAAAEFVELAMQLGGDTISRRLRAAEHHFRAGDMGKTAALLEPARDGMRPGLVRAVALNLLAAVRIYEDDYVAAADLLRQAGDDAADNDAVQAATLLSLGLTTGIVGTSADQIATVRRALSVAERTGIPALTSQALALWVHVSFEQGLGLDEAALQRALELEDTEGDVPIPFRASATRALMLAFTGRLAEAEATLDGLAQRCEERGAENDLMAVTGYQTFVAMWRGRYAEAERFAAQTLERAEQLGGSLVIASSVSAAAAAYRGREHDARRYAQAALDREDRCAPPLTSWARGTLAFLEVSLGRYEQAEAVVRPLVSLNGPTPGTEIWNGFYLPDAVEAFIGTRRFDDAEPLVDALERNGAESDRPWMLAIGKRCRAMLLAARGDLESALATVQRAMIDHDRLPMPFERARTQLLLGEVHRRMRRRDAARTTLREALSTFEDLGAPLWADRARTELERGAGQPRADALELTPSELRIAGFAASGMTNRDVAAALFISVKTVEINLTRVYRKLGIRSRAQLGQRLGRLTQDSDGIDRRGESL